MGGSRVQTYDWQSGLEDWAWCFLAQSAALHLRSPARRGLDGEVYIMTARAALNLSYQVRPLLTPSSL